MRISLAFILHLFKGFLTFLENIPSYSIISQAQIKQKTKSKNTHPCQMSVESRL
jgi:hypothetical protein